MTLTLGIISYGNAGDLFTQSGKNTPKTLKPEANWCPFVQMSQRKFHDSVNLSGLSVRQPAEVNVRCGKLPVN